MIPNLSLRGKTALVTGGKTGIGRAIALGFAEAGADVAVCSRKLEDGQLEDTAQKIRKLGRRSLAIRADISRKTDIDNMVRRVIDEFGVMDILVNNAGIIHRGPLLELREDEWDMVIDTDLKGYFLCSQAAGKHMVNRKQGSIINVVSTLAMKVTTKERGVYAIAKAGDVMLTRALAVELAAYGVRVNAIAPTMVRTSMSESQWTDPEILRQTVADIPLGRIAEPNDYIGTALFLASDASSFVTGQTIPVDGGEMA